MVDKRYSLVVVPEDRSEVRHFQITLNQVRIVVAFLCLLLVTTIFLTLQYFAKGRDAVTITRLKEENAYLWDRMAVLDSSVSVYQVRMASLIDMEKTLRIMAGLPDIDSDVRMVGVGGYSYEELAGPTLSQPTGDISPDMALADVDQLLRQAKLEKQSFQEVEAAFEDHRERLVYTPTIWPTTGYISRGFGIYPDPFTGQRRHHEGLDIVNRVGTTVVTTAAGRIVQDGREGGYGWMVVIDHGYGLQTAYGHLDSIKVKRGQKVDRGQVIATLGNSGRSTGPHLHYEVRLNGSPVNPYRYILPEVIVD